MRPHALAFLAATALLSACSSSESSAAEAPSPSKTAPSGATNEPLLDPEDAVPSQEEADAAAEASIREENADEELEKLEKELAEPGGG